LHVVDVYDDGLVHYYASDVGESDGRSRRSYFGDRYDQVSVGDVSDLSQLVRSFRVHGTDHTSVFQYGTADGCCRVVIASRVDELRLEYHSRITECTAQT
jgi:hypothetical protein